MNEFKYGGVKIESFIIGVLALFVLGYINDLYEKYKRKKCRYCGKKYKGESEFCSQLCNDKNEEEEKIRDEEYKIKKLDMMNEIGINENGGKYISTLELSSWEGYKKIFFGKNSEEHNLDNKNHILLNDCKICFYEKAILIFGNKYLDNVTRDFNIKKMNSLDFIVSRYDYFLAKVSKYEKAEIIVGDLYDKGISFKLWGVEGDNVLYFTLRSYEDSNNEIEHMKETFINTLKALEVNYTVKIDSEEMYKVSF